MSSKEEKYGFETKALHVGQEPEKGTGAVIPPIFQTSTYAQEAPGKHKGYEYSRTQNPTREAFERCLASLEKGKHCSAFSSGMGAATTIMHLLEENSHVICCDDVYGGTFRLFDKILAHRSFDFTFADLTDLEKLPQLFMKNTRMIWIETPTNPLLKVIDIQSICEMAKKNGILTVVDNTFASPYLQNPLDLGADVVLHSTTKYIGGHSDVIGGALITLSDDIAENIRFLQNSMGAIPSPMDMFLSLRSLKTLGVRMERHCSNAKRIVEYLSKNPKVDEILYPGLETHAQYRIAKYQMKDFGGMISVRLKADLEKTKKFLSSLKVFTLAESLGGVESLIEHPAIMTHASVPKTVRDHLGINDGLIRLSVGIEAVDDLIADLESGFAQI